MTLNPCKVRFVTDDRFAFHYSWVVDLLCRERGLYYYPVLARAGTAQRLEGRLDADPESIEWLRREADARGVPVQIECECQ